MPFKGDMRLGGPHDNEASLNGTSSDFDGVPEIGTILSGPTDTSRYVNDYVGTPFYMPYSTTVYANGTGGQNSVETWGLQYLPAGWVTTTSTNQLYVSWNYSLAYDNYQPTGTANYGYETIYHIEDGTGINYTAVISTTLNYTNGQILESSTMGTGADRYRVTFVEDPAFISTNLEDYTGVAPYGTITGYDGGSVYFNAPCQDFVIGSSYGPIFSDGYGGSYGNVSTTYDGASYLGYCGNESDGYHFYYHNGQGGVSEGNPPVGFQLSSYSNNQVLTWNAPDGSSGTFTYESCSGGTYATEYGGTQSSGGCWYAQSGDGIASGSYTYSNGEYDMDGNEIYYNGYWSITYSGSGSYSTYTY